MRSEVMEFYGLTRSLRSAGYYETAHHKELLRDVKHAIYGGSLVVLSGVIGAGKTAAVAQLQAALEREDRVVVSRSVSIEKNRVAIGTLVTALFCDLGTVRISVCEALSSRPDRGRRILSGRWPDRQARIWAIDVPWFDQSTCSFVPTCH